jgi:3-keto-5-aminohexanoate cleavage enzyme
MRRDPVIIEVRANEYTGRADNPNVPFSPEELAADAEACRDAGAAIFHYHARDPVTGAPSTDVGLYAETCRLVRDRTDLIVMPTLGAGTLPTPEERTAHVVAMAADEETRPDLAPIDMGSINLDPYDPSTRRFATEDMVYLNPVRTLRRLAEIVTGAGVKPMLALWNVGGARTLGAFCETGLVAEPVYAQITLSNQLLSAHPATSRGMAAIVEFLPPERTVRWSVLTYGSSALALLGAAVEAGGHVALGLGDWPYPELAPAREPEHRPSNADVVSAAVAMVRALGHEVARPGQAREILGLG